jgi:hypothetical protein
MRTMVSVVKSYTSRSVTPTGCAIHGLKRGLLQEWIDSLLTAITCARLQSTVIVAL